MRFCHRGIRATAARSVLRWCWSSWQAVGAHSEQRVRGVRQSTGNDQVIWGK